MGVGCEGGGDVDGLAVCGDFEVGEDEVSVGGEGEFVFPFERGMVEGIEADAGEGPFAGGEAELVGGFLNVAFEEEGIVGEFFEGALGGFGGGEFDGTPV